jgi:hypothetical protein
MRFERLVGERNNSWWSGIWRRELFEAC